MSRLALYIYLVISIGFFLDVGADPWKWVCQEVELPNGERQEACTVTAHNHPHKRPDYPSFSFDWSYNSWPGSAETSLYQDYSESYEGLAASVITWRSEYLPQDVGKSCEYRGGSGKGVVAQYSKFYMCLEDFDSDGIANLYDDCPFSEDNSYCSDLPDCDPVVEYAVAIATAGIGVYSIYAQTVGTTVIIGGVAVSVSAWVGGAAIGIAVVGATYCFISDVEN